jgi:hypothetical protein
MSLEMDNVKKVLVITLVIMIFNIDIYASGIPENARRIINDRKDVMNIRVNHLFQCDISKSMLICPDEKIEIFDFITASNPSKIFMMIIPEMEPAYFPENQRTFAKWSNWSKPTRSPGNRFFFAVGNCCTYGGKILLYEYNPKDKSVRMILDISNLIGWNDLSHTDGKLHGRMGLMPDGTLWAGTQYGNTPIIFDDKKPGSHLISYNIYTRKSYDWGIPLIENTLAETTLDNNNGILFAAGERPSVLCWDVINKKVLFSGTPPNEWRWFQRASLLDEKGKFWSTDSSDSLYKFLSFDPKKYQFMKYELSTPENPYTHSRSNLRAYTEKRAIDGAFWCITGNGAMFKFWPEKPAVELVGVNWDKGRYTSTIAMDPTGRYLYYMPGGTKMQNANEYGTLVQYDIKTHQKKVLAWLVDYYYEKYGYWVGGTYGMEISKDGSFLVIIMNGAFRIRDDLHDYPYEYPSIFVVHIPESER